MPGAALGALSFYAGTMHLLAGISEQGVMRFVLGIVAARGDSRQQRFDDLLPQDFLHGLVRQREAGIEQTYESPCRRDQVRRREDREA